MAHIKDINSFIPNFFLNLFDVNNRRPLWFVLLLAAMASGAIYTAFWLVIGFVLSTTNQNLISSNSFGVYILVFFYLCLWSSATLWYHIEYIVRYRYGRLMSESAEPEEKTSWSIWGTPLALLLVFAFELVIKLLWMVLRFFVVPMFPFILAIYIMPDLTV